MHSGIYNCCFIKRKLCAVKTLYISRFQKQCRFLVWGKLFSIFYELVNLYFPLKFKKCWSFYVERHYFLAAPSRFLYFTTFSCTVSEIFKHSNVQSVQFTCTWFGFSIVFYFVFFDQCHIAIWHSFSCVLYWKCVMISYSKGVHVYSFWIRNNVLLTVSSFCFDNI